MEVTHLLTAVAAGVATVHAPPAVVFLQPLQCQMPTAVLLTVSFPQYVHVYLACCYQRKDEKGMVSIRTNDSGKLVLD